jgi:deoxycytidylate deaminase
LNYSIVLGITGQFGSGCSTLTDVLSEDKEKGGYGFKQYKFSDLIKAKARERDIAEPQRHELQDIGNEFRDPSRGGRLNHWALEIIKKIESENAGNNNGEIKKIVVDGFRNVAEIEEFRRHFPDFYLIALNVEERNIRWERVKEIYNIQHKTEQQFIYEDERDRNEGLVWGQQVEKCVYHADIILDNPDVNPRIRDIWEKKLKKKLERYINLLLRQRTPVPDPFSAERFMQEAYNVAIYSPCKQRQVGCVITNKNHDVISMGFNTTPNLKTCDDQFEGCYKEHMRKSLWGRMWDWVEGKNCPNPNCKEPLSNVRDNGYRCSKCRYDLQSFFIPTKAAEHCVSIHAEDQAITKAKLEGVESAILYVTTYPCFQCSLKILNTGKIKEIIYVDPYPLPESPTIKKLFSEAGITVQKFEGVKGAAYSKLFSDWPSKKA